MDWARFLAAKRLLALSQYGFQDQLPLRVALEPKSACCANWDHPIRKEPSLEPLEQLLLELPARKIGHANKAANKLKLELYFIFWRLGARIFEPKISPPAQLGARRYCCDNDANDDS